MCAPSSDFGQCNEQKTENLKQKKTIPYGFSYGRSMSSESLKMYLKRRKARLIGVVAVFFVVLFLLCVVGRLLRARFIQIIIRKLKLKIHTLRRSLFSLFCPIKMCIVYVCGCFIVLIMIKSVAFNGKRITKEKSFCDFI